MKEKEAKSNSNSNSNSNANANTRTNTRANANAHTNSTQNAPTKSTVAGNTYVLGGGAQAWGGLCPLQLQLPLFFERRNIIFPPNHPEGLFHNTNIKTGPFIKRDGLLGKKGLCQEHSRDEHRTSVKHSFPKKAWIQV